MARLKHRDHEAISQPRVERPVRRLQMKLQAALVAPALQFDHPITLPHRMAFHQRQPAGFGKQVELQRWRDKRGLKFHLQPASWPFNARLADGLVIAALEAGHDPDPLLCRAFAGVWEDQLDLADPAVLTKMADDCGLPGKQLVERSGSDEISATYEQNRQDALAADVFGSPVYALDGEVFWGQDRIELLRTR